VHTKLARTAAKKQGSSASYFIRPIASTSSAKIAPLMGVPNTAPKPAVY